MAGVQRKLVHKQFNSPMGLYSQENVKATLDRELKAFGADGIEVDEQITKPLNLANSAVLRAVEEEEQQVKCGDSFAAPRQSRARLRELQTSPHHAVHQQLLDQIKTSYLSQQHEVTIDRETVMRINRMSTRRHLPKREHSWPPTELEQTPTIVVSSHAPTPSPTHTHSVDALREKFNSPTRIPEPTVEQLRQQLRPKEQSRAPQPKQLKQSEEEQVTPKAKGFSAPETKAADADIGLVAPKCEYYEQLTHRRAATPTLPASQPYRPRLKRQSYSLERGRSRKRVVTAASTDLPPPKPRSANGTPKLQRRCIKLATELKICYDGDSEEEKQHKVDIDLEAMPLPAVPSDKQRTGTAAAVRESLPSEASAVIDSLAAKQQQQLALVLAMTTPAEQSQLQSQSETRIIPISISCTEEQPLQATAQRIYSEACDYLRQEHTMPEEATPTYISATSGIKLQRQDSNKPKPCNSSCIPTPPPLPPPPTPPAQLRARAKGSAEQDQAKQTRRQGGIYEQHEAHVEIAQLEAKYAHIQQSIAEHLRQIDSYMENAKQALQRSVQATPTPTPPTAAPVAEVETVQPRPELWDMFAARQSPILAVESPLQAILRQIYCRAAGIQQLPKNQLGEESTVPEAKPEENVPIVERALQDLHKIAEALDNEEQKQELLQLEHKQTPTAGEAQTVLIDEEEEEEEEKQAEEPDYKHVSDVIANYEQLAKSDTASSCTHEQLEHTEAGSAGAGAGAGSWCAICGECRDSPHGWGKINQADQWRFNNLQNELLTNYKATYEIRSPYVSRQISWEDAQQQQQQPKPEAEPKPQPQLQPKTETEPKPQPQPQLWRQRSEVQIITAPSSSSLEPEPVQWVRSRSPSPLPARKYPAPLIETAQRCSSPFGLNAVQSAATPTPTPTTLEAKYTHVPQLGQNTGLLVHTATQPLQLCLSSSSTLLAATPPATPRCNSQPPPFDFLLQHGQAPFKSLAASEDGELTQSTRDFSVNRSFDNVSPRPYIGIEGDTFYSPSPNQVRSRSYPQGYKRVAWPPASEERIVREFTPQPQTQSPAPGAGGYYAQPATAPAATSAAPAQGAIYNNVQPRSQHQQHPQQHPQHNYGSSTNYASNGYAPATAAAAPAAATAAQPANHYNQPQQQQQQPIQYTQAQFNRQRSREPTADTYAAYPHQQQQQHQQQQHYQQSAYPQQQQHQHVDNANGWKSIRAPLPKTHSEYHMGGVAAAAPQPRAHSEYHTGGVAAAAPQHRPHSEFSGTVAAAVANYAPYQQQQQQQQQQQHYAQQQQQYRAPSHDHYNQQQHQQPHQQHWQQPHQQQQQAHHQHQQQSPYQTSSGYQQQPHYAQQNGGAQYNAQPQYNSYSQPQQHQQQHHLHYSQDQTDLQHDYRGASPGIITLRKEAPVSQTPAPVYASQPAAVNYRGGSTSRGDMKWPPQEYKEAAAKENEERRQLALGPVCRPRRVNRDYTGFFAKHQLNNTYPSYKVPPGTQHMFA